MGSENYVTVAVPISSCTKGGDRTRDIDLAALLIQAHRCNELLRIGQVGISMSSVEVIVGYVICDPRC